jgi:hypothetical protein
VYRRFISESKPGYETVLAKPYENRYLLQQVPDFYERLKSSYDSQFFEQEVLGQYLHMQGGLVYHAFDRAKHMANVEAYPDQPLLWALDFNVNPMSSVVAQIWRGTVYVLDEIVLRHASTEDACRNFGERFGQHRGGIVVYGDASGNNQHTTGSSDYQIIREFFHGQMGRQVECKVPRSNPQVRDRINLMNAKLCASTGEVALLVNPRCKELIKDFEQVAYKAESNQIDKEKDRCRTHLSDALGYLIWQECRTLPTIGERGKPLL